MSKKPLNIPPEQVKNILVIRKHNQIGDMLCSLPMYAALKKKFPLAQITLVLSPTNYEIDFKELNPYSDEIIFYRKGSVSNIIGFYKNLRKKKYDIGIVPSTVRLSNTSHVVNYFSGAKLRVGAKRINGKPNKASFLLNTKSDFDWKYSHQSERNLEIVRQIGCDLTQEEIKSIQFEINEEDRAFANDFIKKNFPERNRMIVAFHAGAGENFRCWEIENYIKLLKKLYDKYNCYVFTSPGVIDKEVSYKLRNAEVLHGVNLVIAENMPLGKLAAVLKNVKLYITNNTGTLHLAHYSGVSTLALFTTSQVNSWAYKSKTESYVSADNINDIAVEQVFEESCKMINKG